MKRFRSEPGMRVGAIFSATQTTVKFLGYGTYLGDEVPPVPMGMVAAIYKARTWEEWEAVVLKDIEEDRAAGGDLPETPPGWKPPRPTNPKIQLDDGQVVWGCECWWGPVADVERIIGDRSIEKVCIEQARKELT